MSDAPLPGSRQAYKCEYWHLVQYQLLEQRCWHIAYSCNHVTCRSGVSNSASMSCKSAPLPVSFTPSAQSLPAFPLQAPASHIPQAQPPLSTLLFPSTLATTSIAPSSRPIKCLLSLPDHDSTLLPSVQSARPLSDITAALGSTSAGGKPGSLIGQSGAGQRLYDTTPMPSIPLYSADAYSVMTNSLPYCSTWPQKLTDTARLQLATPQAASSLPDGPGLHIGLGKPLRSHIGSDGSSVDSDPAALVEDALLGELFFAQSEACQVTLCGGSRWNGC